MQGSLCLKNGILYVGRSAKTAEIASYDLDGHPLETRFTFRDEAAGRSTASGLSVDDDHRIWVADAPARRVRAFTIFGQEVASIGGSEAEAEDAVGRLGEPVDVVAWGADDALEVLVASRGVRRHALQFFHEETGRVLSLRPLGDPHAHFHGAVGVARSPGFVFVCERVAGRVQVYRDGDFHFALRVPVAGGRRFEPVALAPLEDGRLIVATGGEASAVLVVDPSGRVLATLANAGADEGDVFEPSDVAVEPGQPDAHTRVAVIDRDGDRVQVFTLAGTCYGSFAGLPQS